MRTLPVLLLVAACACTHAPEAPKEYGRCTAVTSPRDLARVYADQKLAFEQASREVAELARQSEALMTAGLNARNRSDRPLTAERTLEAQARLRLVRGRLEAERDRLAVLAGDAGSETPSSALPDGIAVEPRLTAIRDECLQVTGRTDAELSTARETLSRLMAEFQAVGEAYGLPVSVRLSSSPAP